MKSFSLFFLFFIVFFPVSGLDLPVSRISDDSILRNRLRDDWFIDTPHRVLSHVPTLKYLETGERIMVSTLEHGNEFSVFLARERMGGRIATERAPASERRPSGQFPGWAQGSWRLTRNRQTGAPTLIKIFLRSDQNTYIQFRPFREDRSLMDAVVYGAYLTRSLPVPVSFERLYTIPLNDILRLVEGKFPLRFFEPDPSLYRDSRIFVEQVRGQIGSLRFADDGAIDEHGNFVLIDSLQPQNPATAGVNCSGFAKWLIDGILRPVTGQRLPITPLKQPFGDRGSAFTEHWEERRDVFFGLDWIRNLAAEANGTLRSPAHRELEEFEVRSDNFLFIMSNQNGTFVDHSFPGFLNEAGYGMEGLLPLLYTLAIDEPYKFYLAAVSREVATPSHIRGTPRLRQYFHVAAFVPYFDEFGVFRVVVFESAAETSFNVFRNRYPGHFFINLVKIPVSPVFEP